MTRKGISLPINTVVILALAVLVLVVVAAFFVVGSNPATIGDSRAWSTGCSLSIARGCNQADFAAGGSEGGLYIPGYDPQGNDKKGTTGFSQCSQETLGSEGCSDNTLNEACRRSQGISSPTDCWQRCCGTQR